MSICIGIDLGTTNSVLAFTNKKLNGDLVSKVVDISRSVDMRTDRNGTAVKTRTKSPTLPSCVYYVEENRYAPMVGDFAKQTYSVRPHLVAKSIKSQMGRPEAEGLSPDVPDKTPAQISAQILKHMIREASKSLKTEISDAVITVPANFDSAMCQATLEAAAIAGIKIRNPDGTDRPILLSEPNAVIYDLFNQIHNGEIPPSVLDLSRPRTVLVFDLGGGTLDITMHEIKNRGAEDNRILKVNEIASNRYTLLGGDDFDEAIAESMFERYTARYKNTAPEINRMKNDIMPQMRGYAEELKLTLNESVNSSYDEASAWDDEDEEEASFDVGGIIHNTGYSYDDSFTKAEIEDILSVFMADDLVYDDYKRIDKISDSRNIIFPILDVLDKAGKKLNTDNVKVDAVIVNGGMSKFYMVTERLTKFFGFEPIVALDPDQAVARGAAIYHYLLTNNSGDEELKADMKLVPSPDININNNEDNVNKNKSYAAAHISSYNAAYEKNASESNRRHLGIEWGKSILNDCLYLGMRNGVAEELIPTGAELPYSSDIKMGYQVSPGQEAIAIPVKSRNLDGSFRIIASGMINIPVKFRKNCRIAFRVNMNTNKVITMNVWTHSNSDGNKLHPIGTATIIINNDSDKSARKNGTKIIAPTGGILDADAEMNTLIRLCNNYCFQKNKSVAAEKIRISVNNICKAANRKDFIPLILKELKHSSCEETKTRLFIISRKIISSFSEKEKKELASLCIYQLAGALSGFEIQGSKRNTNIQAVYALGFCGSPAQIGQLEKIRLEKKYYQACVYAYMISGYDNQWLIEQLHNDADNFLRSKSNQIQFTAYSAGYALSNDTCNVSEMQIRKVIEKLISVMNSSYGTVSQYISCILALGWICDQRTPDNQNIDPSLLADVRRTLRDFDYIHSVSIALGCEKARNVAVKLLEGSTLSEAEEALLLEKISCVS